MRSTYTYALLEVSRDTYDEVRRRLEAVGYAFAIRQGEDGAIDMSGIALIPEGRARDDTEDKKAPARVS